MEGWKDEGYRADQKEGKQWYLTPNSLHVSRTMGEMDGRWVWLMAGNKWCSIWKLRPPEMAVQKGEWVAKLEAVSTCSTAQSRRSYARAPEGKVHSEVRWFTPNISTNTYLAFWSIHLSICVDACPCDGRGVSGAIKIPSCYHEDHKEQHAIAEAMKVKRGGEAVEQKD